MKITDQHFFYVRKLILSLNTIHSAKTDALQNDKNFPFLEFQSSICQTYPVFKSSAFIPVLKTQYLQTHTENERSKRLFSSLDVLLVFKKLISLFC